MTAMILVIIMHTNDAMHVRADMMPVDVYSSQNLCDLNLRSAMTELETQQRKILGANADFHIRGACVKARAAGPQ